MFSCLTRGVAPDDPCRRYCGLKNQGATCHLNTVLQALYMTPEFRQGLLKLQPGELPPTGKAVCTVFAKMAHGNRTVSTKPLTSALRPVYVCTRQQDCHDTWLMLCDRLESDLKQTPLAKLVAQLFEGRQSDYVKCHKCATVTNTQDTFSNLSLAVPEEEEGASTSQDGDDEEDEEEEDGEETKTQKGDGEEQQQPAEDEAEDEAAEGTTNKTDVVRGVHPIPAHCNTRTTRVAQAGAATRRGPVHVRRMQMQMRRGEGRKVSHHAANRLDPPQAVCDSYCQG